MLKLLYITLIYLFISVSSTGAQEMPQAEIVSRAKPLLHTFVEIKAWGDNAEQAIADTFQEMERLNNLLNNYDPESEVSKINQNAGLSPVPISFETAEALTGALNFCKLSNGAFDITIGPLIRLWGFNREIPGLSGPEPDNDTIAKTKAVVDYRLLEIDVENRTGFLKKKGMWIDTGGFSKAYIADKAVEFLQSRGIENALVAAGGDIATVGKKTDATQWTVGIRHPRDNSSFLTIITLTNRSISTSGDYERFYKVNGRRRTHIIDPRTGMPVETIQSATVIAPKTLKSDCLSTALFVLGHEKGLALIEDLPETEALMVTHQGEVVFSSGWPVKVFTY